MRIVIVVPRQPDATGNHVSAVRHRDGLRRLGHRTEILQTAPGEPFPAAELRGVDPDVVHLLHAFKTGQPWLAGGYDLPFVVTLTGTDIHQGIEDPAQAPVIEEVCRRADAVLTQNRVTFARLQGSAQFRDRLQYLPPGIVLGNAPSNLRERIGAAAEAIVFLHPAGIRPVKRNLELLRLCVPLAAEHPQLRLAFCGPVLDPAYGERFRQALAAHSWATWLGTLPATAMPAAMRQADVILNDSECEGLPNALLEATAVGRPILARVIDGNLAVVEPGINGLLYRDDAEFAAAARELLHNAFLRRKLSTSQADLYDPARESERLADLYTQILAAK